MAKNGTGHAFELRLVPAYSHPRGRWEVALVENADADLDAHRDAVSKLREWARFLRRWEAWRDTRRAAPMPIVEPLPSSKEELLQQMDRRSRGDANEHDRWLPWLNKPRPKKLGSNPEIALWLNYRAWVELCSVADTIVQDKLGATFVDVELQRVQVVAAKQVHSKLGLVFSIPLNRVKALAKEPLEPLAGLEGEIYKTVGGQPHPDLQSATEAAQDKAAKQVHRKLRLVFPKTPLKDVEDLAKVPLPGPKTGPIDKDNVKTALRTWRNSK